MKVVLAHSFYRNRGGEEEVFQSELDLLTLMGHEVRTFTAENEDLVAMGSLRKAAATIWNPDVYRRLRAFLHEDPPDIVHVHNTFPLLSPAVYDAAAAEGIPVVQTLHNYRLLCPGGLLYRDGDVCEKCIGRSIPWPAVVHRCYRSDRAASAVTAAMLGVGRLTGTWARKVSVYIALTNFAREKLIQGGIPADRIYLKPNFVADPGRCTQTREGYALFVGRLSAEKGIMTLLKAWKELPSIPLRIVGGGPLEEEVRREVEASPSLGHVEILGFRSQTEVAGLMKRARCLVFPSEWYEGAPRVVLEAFACGLPVIGARIGAMTELLEEGRTGCYFTPGDPADLIRAVRSASEAFEALGRQARLEYEAKYTPATNYLRMMELYRVALARTADAFEPAALPSAR